MIQSQYKDRFDKKSIGGKEGNLFIRVEALEEMLRSLVLSGNITTQNIQNIIYENREIILSSIAGGTLDPTDATFTGIVISPSGQTIGGVLYNFALVIDGVVFNGLGESGGEVVVSGLNIDASFNIAILSAISSLMTGNNNIAAGQTALINNTSGDGNVSIGQNTLRDNTSGDANVAISNNALAGNTSGARNTAIGNNALEVSEDGNDNIGIGDGALSAMVHGERNIAIGKYSGIQETNISDRLFIDNRDRGSETAGRTDALIYGVFADDPVDQELHFNANVDVNGDFTVNGSPVSGSGLSQAQVMARMS